MKETVLLSYEKKHRNKSILCNITSIAQLKLYCTKNNIDIALYLNKNHMYDFYYKNKQIEKHICLLCSHHLKIDNIDQVSKRIFFNTHSCMLNAGDNTKIVYERFLTIFDESTAKTEYEAYRKNKTKNWSGNTTSLEAYIKKYGEVDGAIKHDLLRKKLCDNNVSNCTLEYYLNKNMSEEQAYIARRERQNTFSLEKCIKKHGEVEGKNIWKNRQIEWQKKLQNKSEEEKKQINIKKINFNKKYSNLSQILFNALHKNDARYATNGGEYKLKTTNGMMLLDFVYKNKVIEFNGDLWHANPFMYKPEDTPLYRMKQCTITAEEIWQNDILRYDEIRSHGFDLLIVWENEFKNNKHYIIQKCLEFINA